MIDFEKAEQDINWIETAINDPTYLLLKQDKSNMFELSDDSEGYIHYVICELKNRGFKVYRIGKFVGVEK